MLLYSTVNVLITVKAVKVLTFRRVTSLSIMIDFFNLHAVFVYYCKGQEYLFQRSTCKRKGVYAVINITEWTHKPLVHQNGQIHLVYRAKTIRIKSRGLQVPNRF